TTHNATLLPPLRPQQQSGYYNRLCAAYLACVASTSDLERARHRYGTRGSRTSLPCICSTGVLVSRERAQTTVGREGTDDSRCLILLGGDGSLAPTTCARQYDGETLRP
ncbi:unnamed protein product, partial [Laminaria digitata]